MLLNLPRFAWFGGSIGNPVLKSDFKKLSKYFKSHPKQAKTGLILLPIFIFSLISWVYFGPSHLSWLHNSVFNNGGDSQQFIWFYNWWPYAISHHLNPFITKYVWYPSGYNLSWSTSIPTLSIIMAPITYLWGAILSYNLVALLSPVLSAIACFYLVKYLTKRYWPSMIAGYIYGFSTIELSEILGHPQVYFNCLIPILILLLCLRFKKRIKRLTFILLTILCLILQFGISMEIFAVFIVFSFIALVALYLLNKNIRQKLISLAIEFYGSLILSLILLGPFIYFLIKGYHSIPRQFQPVVSYSVSALNTIIPTQITLFGGHLFRNISSRYVGNIAENGAYIGLPFIALLSYIFIKFWRHIYLRALSILLIVYGILALGPRLHLISKPLFELPWDISLHLPIIRSALPDRFMTFIFLIIAIIIGLWLSFKATKSQTVVKYLLVTLAIISIIPSTGTYIWQSVQVPAIFNKPLATKYFQNKPNILVLPFGKIGSSMYYQYASGMAFTQSAGYVGPTPQMDANNQVVLSLLSGKLNPNFISQFRKYLILNKIQQIIYLAQTPPQLVAAINSLNWPLKHIHGVWIVAVELSSGVTTGVT